MLTVHADASAWGGPAGIVGGISGIATTLTFIILVIRKKFRR